MFLVRYLAKADRDLAFRFAIFVLEMPRSPAATNFLEIKLSNLVSISMNNFVFSVWFFIAKVLRRRNKLLDIHLMLEKLMLEKVGLSVTVTALFHFSGTGPYDFASSH